MTKAKTLIALWNKTQNRTRYRHLLLDSGWRIIGFGLDAIVFGKKGVNFVVKLSDNLPTRKFKEPCLERYRLGYLYISRNRKFGLQRRVKIGNEKTRYKAWRMIQDTTDSERPITEYDIHQDNVGWLDGKPIIFDYS